MSEQTAISWATSTWNGWIGCTKVSPGCDHCYAELLDRNRFSKTLKPAVVHWGAGAPRHRTSPANWKQPLKWNEKAKASGKPWRVFCSSLADVFDNEAPDEWRADLFRLIEATPALTWMLLTKRIGNVRHMLPADWLPKPGVHFASFPPNVWVGITVVNQEEAERDIPKLLAVPNVAVRWLSCEPLLEAIDLAPFLDRGSEHMGHHEFPRVDWVIVGGESGKGARPFVLGWAKDIVRQCQAAGAPVHVKQLGSNPTNREGQPHPQIDHAGRDMAEWPQALRVQEWPV